jgi:hypothetical protein
MLVGHRPCWEYVQYPPRPALPDAAPRRRLFVRKSGRNRPKPVGRVAARSAGQRLSLVVHRNLWTTITFAAGQALGTHDNSKARTRNDLGRYHPRPRVMRPSGLVIHTLDVPRLWIKKAIARVTVTRRPAVWPSEPKRSHVHARRRDWLSTRSESQRVYIQSDGTSSTGAGGKLLQHIPVMHTHKLVIHSRHVL